MVSEITNKKLIRQFHILFAIFGTVVFAVGLISYNHAGTLLKHQLVSKCRALAATVSVIIEEDSDGYAAFLDDMDTESDYYERTKSLMMKLKQLNEDQVAHIYTTIRADGDNIMYVIDGDHPSLPTYIAPGVTDTITATERAAYDGQKTVSGDTFENTAYGVLISAYEPVIHKETGEFLGMAGADITRTQYDDIMTLFITQTAGGIIAGIVVLAFVTRWLSGSANLIVNRQLYAARESEQKLAAENAALERMNRLKSDLMSTISHEARTPLAVLSGYAGLVSMELQLKGADKKVSDDLGKIISEAKRVANLIESLEKITMDKTDTAECVRFDIGALVKQTAELYRHILERRGIEINVHIEEDLYVSGRPEKLTQVIFNILQNAKEHTDSGSVTVTAAEENGEIVVTVADTGAGVPPEILPKLFERGIKGSEGGMGIGLAICKEIMDFHGGAIYVENREPKGASVTFKLPAYEGEDENGTQRDGAFDRG